MHVHESGAASMGGAVGITRVDLTARSFGRRRDGRRMVRRRGGCWLLRWCSMGRTASRRPRPAAWIARRCGTGCIATTPRASAACTIGKRQVPATALRREQQAELARLVEAGPDPAVHGVVRWRRVDLRADSTALRRRAARSSVGQLLASSATAGCRCDRAIRRPTKPRRRRLKKLCRDSHGTAP